MKTPRDIILEQHRASTAKLDALRKGVLSQELGAKQMSEAKAPVMSRKRSVSEVVAEIWREVIWRSRAAWIGMAALWLVLWMVNRQAEPESARVVSARSRPNPEAVRAFEEQRRFLVEMLQPAFPEPAEPPRPRPQPRSELRITLRAC